MTGPEHYREAERLVRLGKGLDASGASVLAAAQVHATLALAAATALNDHASANGSESVGGLPRRDEDAWQEVAGTTHWHEETEGGAPDAS